MATPSASTSARFAVPTDDHVHTIRETTQISTVMLLPGSGDALSAAFYSLQAWIDRASKLLGDQYLVDLIDPQPLHLDAVRNPPHSGAPEPAAQSGSTKRKASGGLLADWEDEDLAQEGDDQLWFLEAKRPRLGAPSNSQSITTGGSVPSDGASHFPPAGGWAAPSGPRTQAANAPISSIKAAHAQPAPRARQAVRTAPRPQTTANPHTQQLAPANGGTVTGSFAAPPPVAQPMPGPAMPHVSAAQQLLPTGPAPPQAAIPLHQQQQPGFVANPRRKRIPNARLASRHPIPAQAPGSVRPTGKGNHAKAWSAERCRAFMEIQGHPYSELPQTYNSPYGDELSRSHTPMSIDPRHFPFDVTMEELVTYMTYATTINRELCARAKRYWTAQEIVHYVYWALDLQHEKSLERTRVQKRFQKCADGFDLTYPQHTPVASVSSINTMSGLTGDDKDTHDFYLHAMGVNVVNHPTGHHAQLLSRIIDHVLNNTGDTNVRLSQAADYAQRHNITVPAAELMNSNLDVADTPDPAIMAVARAAYKRKFG